VARTVMAFTVDESEGFAVRPEIDSTDRYISACYLRIQSFELAIRDKQKSRSISEETPPHMLREIADRAFALGWNTDNLTHLQRAQILDIIFRIAELTRRINN
jgi:hypothetical protein